MIVFSSSAFHTGMLLTKSEVLSSTGPSAPLTTISSLLAQFCLDEHVFEPNAAPDRIAHRTGAPLHPRHMRLRPSTAVAGALAHGNDLDLLEPCLQPIEGQLKRRGRGFAGDLQPPAIGI